MSKKRKRICIILAATAILIVVGMYLSGQLGTPKDGYNAGTSSGNAAGPSYFEIHFFDMGEADAALVECDGHFMLIDGGNPDNSSFLYSYLRQHGIGHLDYVICSHPHVDHVGGLAGALHSASVGAAYCPVTEYNSRAFSNFVKYLAAQGKTITVPSPGQTIQLGSARVTFIGPTDMTLAEQNENDASLILRIEYGATSFLFAGDAGKEEELSVLNSGEALKSTLLKVGHHGSYSSSSKEFLEAVQPEYAVISCGKDNDYNHPHNSVLKRLGQVCDTIYRTDLDGEIVCRSDGKDLVFSFPNNDPKNDQ